ncbi:WG repeat-containing protein [Coprobacter fastidiosus]|uniref:WG repeat-containing protein n=1 Tax=Coprobacter fastidiosus TaxID=1099853 RepID=UPI0026655F5B|nr:WG repeat-containing protein [Coprobacter fastidiosus]
MVARKVKYCLGAVLVSLFVFSACNSQSGRIESVTLIPVWHGDSCLYINAEDKMEFNGLYPSVSLFREDIALVQTAGRGARIGFIDNSGEFVLPAVYTQATVFREGMAFVVRPGEAPCAINQKGELKFTLRDAESVETYHEDMALYSIREKGKLRYGYVDKKGEPVIEPVFSGAMSFSRGKAAVRDDKGKWGFIDKGGEAVIECRYDEAMPFNDRGVALVREDRLWGAIDEKGKYVVDPQFEMMCSDGKWFQVKSEENLWGWCDLSGEIVISPRFEKAFGFFDGDRAPVLLEEKWAYIDRKGMVVIKPQFDRALPFVGNLAAVWVGDYIGFINKEGRYEINPQYNGLSHDYEANAVWGESCYERVTTGKK